MKVFIAIPCMDSMPVDFVRSLTNLQTKHKISINYSVGSLIYASRDYLAGQAIKSDADYVLWLDSDMVFNENILDELLEHDKDFVTGAYFRRKPPYTPVLYKKIRMGATTEECITEEFGDFPRKRLFEVDSCGFGACVMKVQVLKDVLEKKGQMFSPITGYGEDISFCIRAKSIGYKIYCDKQPYLGHVAKSLVDRETYARIRGKQWH